MIIHRILLATSIAFFALIHSSHGLAATARKAGGGGFGAKTSTISDLTPDTSPEIQTLLAVLQQQKAEINNVAVGHHPTHGIGHWPGQPEGRAGHQTAQGPGCQMRTTWRGDPLF